MNRSASQRYRILLGMDQGSSIQALKTSDERRQVLCNLCHLISTAFLYPEWRTSLDWCLHPSEWSGTERRKSIRFGSAKFCDLVSVYHSLVHPREFEKCLDLSLISRTSRMGFSLTESETRFSLVLRIFTGVDSIIYTCRLDARVEALETALNRIDCSEFLEVGSSSFMFPHISITEMKSISDSVASY